MPEIYNKPPLSVSEQIELLTSRGLIIPDKNEAYHYLSSISYYRFSGYAIYFEGLHQGKRNHQFKAHTTFKDIIDLYNFDRLLRLLVMDAIERIEVAIRTQICLNLALIYEDSHWYLRQNIYKSKFKFEKFLNECQQKYLKSPEVFVLHYKNSYAEPTLPPCWMLIELLPLGTWSIVYENLVNRQDKKTIANFFDLSPVELQSWLHTLTYIRNLCAHHARLWNRHFTITPIIKPEYQTYLSKNYTFAAQAAMVHILLKIISPHSKWVNHLIDLIMRYPAVNIKAMGFKEKWQEDIFWLH